MKNFGTLYSSSKRTVVIWDIAKIIVQNGNRTMRLYCRHFTTSTNKKNIFRYSNNRLSKKCAMKSYVLLKKIIKVRYHVWVSEMVLLLNFAFTVSLNYFVHHREDLRDTLFWQSMYLQRRNSKTRSSFIYARLLFLSLPLRFIRPFLLRYVPCSKNEQAQGVICANCRDTRTLLSLVNGSFAFARKIFGNFSPRVSFCWQ